MDNNPRPQKRAKIDYLPNSLPSLTSSPLTPLPSPPKPSPKQDQLEQHNQYDHDSVIKLKPMPSPALLVSLPGLLIHPPNHRYHVLSLQLSLKALRKCLGLPGLTPEVECRAWMGFAEVGMNVIGGGLTEDEGCVWAKGIEAEVGVFFCFYFFIVIRTLG